MIYRTQNLVRSDTDSLTGNPIKHCHRILRGALALALMTAAANAQTVRPEALDQRGFHNGDCDSVWKITNPAGHSDYFNVDFEDTLIGEHVGAVTVRTFSLSAGAHFRRVGIYGPNLTLDPTGQTPGLLNVITETELDPVGAPLGESLVAFDVPDVLVTQQCHVVLQFSVGASPLYVCADDDASGQSFFSQDGYATGAISFPGELGLGAGVIPPPGSLWINGGSQFTAQAGEELCLLFNGTHGVESCGLPGQPWMIFLGDGAGNPVLSIGPGILETGNSVFSLDATQVLCAPLTPGFTGSFSLLALYLEPSQGAVALTNEAFVQVN